MVQKCQLGQGPTQKTGVIKTTDVCTEDHVKSCDLVQSLNSGIASLTAKLCIVKVP